jgi:23S rRNA pseudouridine1911/1915/1917 synthase
MTVTEGSGRRAITHYHVLESFDRFSLVDLTLDTGRTHQIRLHLSHIGHPIVGDPVYGGGDKRALNDASSSLVRQSFLNLGRQALHARSLEFEHPLTRERVAYCSPLPTDIQSAIMTLSNPSDFA